MSTPTESTADATSPETEIRKQLTEWCAALYDQDMDRMMKLYSPDILLFDMRPPFRIQGADAYRKRWEDCFPYMPGKIGTDLREVKILVSGDMAFATCFNRLSDGVSGKPIGNTWVRATLCFQRMDGVWKVVHEHASVPVHPESSEVAWITEL